MIEQLHISTTAKYNFPHLIEFPQQFLELSIKTLRNSNAQISQTYLQSENFIDELSTTKFNNLKATAKLQLIKLKPLKEEVPIAAIDVSSIKIGETSTGVVIAVRGAIVYLINKKYRYLKLGPFPLHITEENKNEVYRFFRAYPVPVQNEIYDVTMAPEVSYLQSRITSLFERWLHSSLASSMHGGIILWDGSLTVGTPERPVTAIRDIMENAKKNGNIVLAISKVSRIRVGGRQISDFASNFPSPCLLKLEELLFKQRGIKNLGKIYLAKLNGSKVFRLDIYHGFSIEEGVRAVERLLGNDLLVSGYPETLRLAHIFSTFTANEVVGIQRYLNERFNLRVINRPSIRRVLFGPFGKEHET